MLELYIDFKCPASYLALQPSLDMAWKANADIRFRAFDSTQHAVPMQKDIETRSESHIRVRAEQCQNIHKQYAKARGLTMVFRGQPGETIPALAMLESWDGAPLPFIREAFTAYWEQGADLGHVETVQTIAAKAGRTVSPDEMREACQRFEEIRQAGEDRPVFTTPTYLVAGHIFVGRENLPWISELLQPAS